MEWQPIETAPKDKVILLYRPNAFAWGMVAPGRWEAQKFHKKPSAYWEICLGIGCVTNARDWAPTHWMPLPPPPIEDQP